MTVYKMLPAQKNIYNITKKYSDSGICNLGGLLCFETDKDIELLKKACEHILKTNSNFWIKINEQGDIYFDEIEKCEFEIYDFADKDQSHRNEIYQEWMDELLFANNTYLFDVKVVICKEYNALFVKAHHIIGDGFSVALFAGKLEEVYDKMMLGQELPGKDYSYREKIDSASDSIGTGSYYKVLNKAQVNPKASCVYRSILVNKDYLRKNHVTLEALFYTAFALYLNNAHSCKKVKVLRNLVNRSKKEYKTIGMYVLTSGFEYDINVNSEISIKDYLADLRKELSVHATKCVNEETGADVIISYRPDKLMEKLSRGKCIEIVNSFSEVPLKILMMEKRGEVLVRYMFQEEAFSKDYIDNMSIAINRIIECIVSEQYEKISDIPVLSREDKTLYDKLNDTENVLCQSSLLERFVENVRQFPHKTALVDEREYSYKEVWKLVTLVSEYINNNADKNKEGIICVSLPRSKWHPVLIYAAWLSGYSYMPLNPQNSYEHNKKIYEKCSLLIDEDCIDRIRKNKSYYNDAVIENRVGEVSGPAYYMFTSGTTKEPKAVEISHDSLNERITWMAEEFEDGTEKILHKTNNSFDVSMWEITLSWAFGKTLYIAKEGTEKNPSEIFEYLDRYGITMVHFVPSMFKHFLDYIEKKRYSLPLLKYIVLSGERLDGTLVKRAYKLMKNVVLYNLYGPTECTIDVTYYRCRGDEEVVPIGKPVSGTKIYIYNKDNRLVIPGEQGELVVAGNLVGKYSDIFAVEKNNGYVTREDQRLYYTKDMAHLGKDGLIYYDGREDSQIKIRGMRVDVNALESAVNSEFPDCMAVMVYDNNRLICVYEGNEKKEKLTEFIKNNFPYYYMPSAVINTDRIPVNKNGKADKNKVAAIINSDNNNDYIGSDNEIWEIDRIKKVLTHAAGKYIPNGLITGSNNLYDMGMDSLSALSYLDDLEKCGISITYSNLFSAVNVNELADYIYHKGTESSEDIVYFSRTGKKELIVTIPFAAGTPLSFYNMFTECDTGKYDFAVACTNGAIDKIIRSDYEKVHIISSCVGSSRALLLCRELKKRAGSLILCESIPYRGVCLAGRIYTIWDFLPDNFISSFLCRLRRKKFLCNKEMIARFRQDVRESAQILRTSGKFTPECPVMCIYGEKDILTKGYSRKYKQWNRYIDADISLRSITDANHFLVEDNANEVYNLFDNE